MKTTTYKYLSEGVEYTYSDAYSKNEQYVHSLKMIEPSEVIALPLGFSKFNLDSKFQQPVKGVKKIIFNDTLKDFCIFRWMFPDLEEIDCTKNQYFEWCPESKILYKKFHAYSYRKWKSIAKVLSSSEDEFKWPEGINYAEEYAFEGTRFKSIDFSGYDTSCGVENIVPALQGSEWIKHQEDKCFILKDVLVPLEEDMIIDEYVLPESVTAIYKPLTFRFGKLTLKNHASCFNLEHVKMKCICIEGDNCPINSETVIQFGNFSELERFEINTSRYKSIDGVLYSADGKDLIRYPEARSGESFSVPDGVEIIKKCAFHNVKLLHNLHLADSVRYIEQDVFSSSSIENITLSKGMRMIDKSTFFKCDNLKSIHIPGNISYVGDNAFSGCSIKDIEIEEGVEYIGYMAFGVSSIQREIVLPKSARFIGNNAFVGIGKVTVQSTDIANLFCAFDNYKSTTLITAWNNKKYLIPPSGCLPHGYIEELNIAWNENRLDQIYGRISENISGAVKHEWDLFNFINKNGIPVDDISGMRRYAKKIVLLNMQKDEQKVIEIIESDVLTKAYLNACLEEAQKNNCAVVVSYIMKKLNAMSKTKNRFSL